MTTITKEARAYLRDEYDQPERDESHYYINKLLDDLETTEVALENEKTHAHRLWCEEANTTLGMCGIKEKLDAA